MAERTFFVKAIDVLIALELAIVCPIAKVQRFAVIVKEDTTNLFVIIGNLQHLKIQT